jgi:anti-anti-sigma factor
VGNGVSEKMIVDYEMCGDCKVGIVKVEGDLTTITVDIFRNEVAVLIAPRTNVRNYVVDFSQVDFIDSAGLGSLLSIVKHVRDMKGEVKLARLKPAPQKLFDMVHAYKHFEIFDSLEKAIDSYN